MTFFNPCPKEVYWRSSNYMNWVSKQPSMLSGKIGCAGEEQRNDPHHHRKGTKGGTGIKPSDVYIVPLTHDEHVKVESGIIELDELQVMKTALEQLNKYLVERNIK